MSIIKSVISGDWAGLQDHCHKRIADKILTIINEKKAGVIAKLNGITEASLVLNNPVDREREEFYADQDSVKDMVANWIGDHPEANIDWDEAVDEVLANVDDYTDDISVYSYLDTKYLGESVVTEAKKEDPKAEVRNKPDCIFDNTSKLVKDNKDHFPIPDEQHARNALSRVNQYKKVPAWFDGDLETLVKKVVSVVRKKYPKIKITKAAERPGKN